MKFFLKLLILWFITIPAWPNLYFSADFEGGKSLTSSPVEPGQSRIQLIKGTELKLWPETGSRGIIEGENPCCLDTFSYGMRRGLSLLEIKGIHRPHNAHVAVNSRIIGGWDESSSGIGLDCFNPISGMQSLLIEKDGGIYKNLDSLEQVWISFKVKFDSRSIHNLRPEGWIVVAILEDAAQDIGMELAVCRPRGSANAYFKAGHETDRPYFKFHDNHEYIGDYFKNIPVEPWEDYYVQMHYNIHDKESKLIRLYVNSVYEGFLFKKQEGKTYYKGLFEPVQSSSDYRGLSRVGLRVAEHIGLPVLYDDMVLSDKPAKTQPRRPFNVTPGNSDTCQSDNIVLTASPFRDPRSINQMIASHWQISQTGSWALPLYNSGEIPDTLDTFKVPGIMPGRSKLFWRVRYKNNDNRWSPWSIPSEFHTGQASGKSELPIPQSPVNDITFSGNSGEAPTVISGEWFDLGVKIKEQMTFKDIEFIDIFLHHYSFNIGNIKNRGSHFDPERNYFFSYSTSRGKHFTVFIKQVPGKRRTMQMTDKMRFRYVDSLETSLEMDTQKGTARARVKLLENAKPGLWIASAYAVFKGSTRSSLFTRKFLVENMPSRNTGKKVRILFSVIILMILLIFLTIWLRKPGDRSVDQGLESILQDVSEKNRGFIQKACSFMEEKYGNEISLEDIAKSVNISKSYLSSIFRREVRISLNDYLTKLRISKAKELMKTTNLTISQIVYKTGFSDPSYFTKVFKKFEKMNPTDYKIKIQQQ
jgi:AraC-like DNA-binding protein